MPAGTDSLVERLGEAWPDYLAYATTFITIGIMWANHHAIFRLISHTGHGLIVANLFLLLAVSFLPLPAQILGEDLGRHGADQTSAAVFYNACFVGVAAFFNLVWLLACRAGRFVPDS